MQLANTAPAIGAASSAKPQGPPGFVAGRRWVRRVGYIASALSIVAVCVTFFVFLGLTSIEPSPRVIAWALAINGVLLLSVLAAVALEIAQLWIARRRGEAAARLHIRIVALFALVAVTPAVLVAIVANITFAQGVDHWFSSRTQAIVETSVTVANAYNETQIVSLGEVVAAMKRDIEAMRSAYVLDRQRFQSFFDGLPESYGAPGVFLINAEGDPVVQAQYSISIELPAPPRAGIAEAAAIAPQVSIIPPTAVTGADGGTRAFAAGIVKLADYIDLYLYVVAELDPRAVGYLQLAADNAVEYQNLSAIRSGMQVVFGLIYFGVALVVLAAAIWLGLAFATRLVSPIGRLIDAADRVAGGDLQVGVAINRSDGDIAALGASFNKMTHQLRSQRGDLVAASEQIDSRRRFIEAVLSGATAGVIGVEGDGLVTIVNRMALRILNLTVEDAVGARIADLVPELGPVTEAVRNDRRQEHSDQVTLARAGRSRTINVRVTTEGRAADGRGYVVTLDDITDLVTAQRTAVWADVARRIAHEIKNPLTPIQLSAERLRRKFGRAIVDDRDIFDQCVDTIIRQVGDIGRMVDEFASFARMPKPTLEAQDLRNSLRDAVFLMQVGNPEIEFKVSLPDRPMLGRFDSRLIVQVITNVLKNAAEAIGSAGPRAEKGRIELTATIGEGVQVVDVIDNGVGFPRENRQLLLEPYMTTREKGTGLGLAIVKKIVEEHSGRIELLDAPAVAAGGQGAMIRLVFPQLAEKADASPQDNRRSAAAGDDPESQRDQFAAVAE